MIQTLECKQNVNAYMLLSWCISPSDTILFNAVQNATTDPLLASDAKMARKISVK
jgi:hypothetical protein